MLFTKLNALVMRLQKSQINRACYSSYEFKEQKIKVDKWDINYLKVGRGPHNVLCLPGALGTIWTDFKCQVEGFDKDKFTVIVWDPPGYGKSRPPDKEFTADFYEKDADWAAEFMKALNIPKYSVLAWSDGGTTGLIHTAKYVDAVIKLVAFASKSFILPHEYDWCISLRDVSLWSEKRRKPFEDIYGKDKFAQYWAMWNDAQTSIIINKENRNICSELLRDIKCPTFLLCGGRDTIVDPSHSKYLHKHIADSRYHFYPDGGHNIHISYAEDFNKRVQDFLLS